MSINKRERPTVTGKDAERFLSKVKERNKKMEKRKGDWVSLSQMCSDHMKKTGLTVEDARRWLKEIREDINKNKHKDEDKKKAALKSLGSVKLKHEIDIQEICREVRGK